MRSKQGSGSKQRILDYFLAHVGTVLDSRDIQKASGWAAEWARRVRELRNEEGYQILSHKDRVGLKPGQYLLETTVRFPASKWAFLRRYAHRFLSATVTPARCVVSRPVILTRSAGLDQLGSQWGT